MVPMRATTLVTVINYMMNFIVPLLDPSQMLHPGAPGSSHDLFLNKFSWKYGSSSAPQDVRVIWSLPRIVIPLAVELCLAPIQHLKR